MRLPFANLLLSPKHKVTRNADEATTNWPDIYFWTRGLMLLNWVPAILHQLRSLDAKAQEGFWEGSIPAQFFNDFPRLKEFPPKQVAEYCQVRQSMDRARRRLIIRARGDRENPNGAEALGDVRIDEKHSALNQAAKFKSVGRIGQSEYISSALKRNDVRFFIQLGKKLQSKQRRPEVDWSGPGCDRLARFLIENWCEGQAFNALLPALCFFADQALADFCSIALSRNPSLPAIRKCRQRLGLKQASSPRVKTVTIKGSEILFEGK
jgi:hypothetical protein